MPQQHAQYVSNKPSEITAVLGRLAEPALFYGLLGVLIWAPLPWGSNAPWGKNLLCFSAFSLSAAWLLLYCLGWVQLTVPLRRAGGVLALLAGVQVWVLLQWVPLPTALVEALSSEAAALHQVASPGASRVPLSLDPAATLQSSLLGLAYCALFCLALLTLNNPRRIRQLCTVAVACGVFQACYGGFMMLSGLEYSFFLAKDAHLGKATGTYLNGNHLACFLTQCLALGIGLLLADARGSRSRTLRQAARRWLGLLLSPKARLRLYLAIMVIGLVLSVSRMGNASFFASLSIAGLLAIAAGARRGKRLQRGTVLLFASLLLVDLVIVGQWFGFDAVVERLERTDIDQEARGDVWRDAGQMLIDYPATGTGAGSFAVAFPRYRGPAISHHYYSAENDYLEFATDLGIAASLPLLATGALSLGVAVGALFRRRDPLLRAMAFSSTMAIIAMAIHATVDFNLRIPANAAWFMVLLALGWISATLPHGGATTEAERAAPHAAERPATG